MRPALRGAESSLSAAHALGSDFPEIAEQVASPIHPALPPMADGLVRRGAQGAPEVSSTLPEVLDHHAGTIEIRHMLRPLIVCRASANAFDPYKE